MMTTKEYVDGLRALADWYEAHPDVPIPREPRIGISCADTKEEVQRIARLAAPCEKSWSERTFCLTRTFGPLRLEFIFWRSTVCTRRVVGTKTIDAQPAQVVEVVEWDCESILAPEPQEVQP